MNANGGSAIVLKNVWIRYDEATVLEEINMTVGEREIVSIVGPNGSGKTTLLKCIMGFKDPFRGTIEIFGRSPKQVRHSGIFGYLPQSSQYDLNFPVNVFDVVAMARYSKNGVFERLTKEDRAIINESLEKVEMRDFIRHHFGSLSGGQKQRVLIARALANRPKILMLDEPSTGLDAVSQDNFYQLLRTLREREGLTILMVSHDIGAVSNIVDRLACIRRKMHFHGKVEECAPDEAMAKVFGKNIYIVSHDKTCEQCGDKE
jgi:zinc transport system ATP-binding protein